MPTSSDTGQRKLAILSVTFPKERIDKILSVPGIYQRDGHFEYPLSVGTQKGNHLDALFLIEPIVRHSYFIDWIVEDICAWMASANVDCNLIFAPAQPAVKSIVDRLAAAITVPTAYWEYLPGGWFGDKLVSGVIEPGSKVFVFNAVSATGRCIGERLPAFVEEYRANVVSVGAFALGTTDSAITAKRKYGQKLYSAVEVPLNIFAPENCPTCVANSKGSNVTIELTPWTQIRDKVLAGS